MYRMVATIPSTFTRSTERQSLSLGFDEGHARPDDSG
jgi:hypothetical protein